MALSLDFKVYVGANFDSITFQETTSTYDVSTNPGGWGTPNPSPSGTTPANEGTLTITHDWDEQEFDAITVTPSSVIADTTIALADLDVAGVDYFTDTLTDGVYSFVYSVVVSGTTYTKTVKKLMLPQLSCTLAEAALKIVDGTCPCSKQGYEQAWLIGFARVEALKAMEVCGDTSLVSTAYTNVQNYLSNLKCNC